MGEGEEKPGGKPEESHVHAPMPGGSVSKEKKFGESKPRKYGNEKPKEGAPEEEKKGPSRKATLGPVYKREWTNEKEGGDKTYAKTLQGKVSVEALTAAYDVDKKSVSLTAVEISAEGSLVHGQVDLIDKLKHLFSDDPKPPPPTPTAPMAARMGDLTMHLGPLAPGPGSPNVMIGGKPAWRVGLDVHLCPAPGAAPHGGGPTSPGATTVLINGAPAARATDFVVEPTGGPDVIAIGFPTVLIGIPTPPPPPPPPAPEDLPWVKFESVAAGDLGKGEAKVTAKGDLDLSKMSGKVEAEAEAFVGVFKGELPLKIRLRIPFTSYYVGLGLKVEGSVLSLGASANARGVINEDGKLFDGSVGAKVGAGVAGVGVKASVDVSK